MPLFLSLFFTTKCPLVILLSLNSQALKSTFLLWFAKNPWCHFSHWECIVFCLKVSWQLLLCLGVLFESDPALLSQHSNSECFKVWKLGNKIDNWKVCGGGIIRQWVFPVPFPCLVICFLFGHKAISIHDLCDSCAHHYVSCDVSSCPLERKISCGNIHGTNWITIKWPTKVHATVDIPPTQGKAPATEQAVITIANALFESISAVPWYVWRIHSGLILFFLPTSWPRNVFPTTV